MVGGSYGRTTRRSPRRWSPRTSRSGSTPRSPRRRYVDVIASVDDSDAPLIVDYKTAKRAKSANDLANDLQLAIYAWALGIERVAFVTLCKTKTPKVEIITGVVSPEQQAWAVQVVEGVMVAINAGVFPPCDPGSWICSASFCGHWGRCRGRAFAA